MCDLLAFAQAIPSVPVQRHMRIADLAAVTIGATPYSIYVTYPAEEIEYLINDADTRVAIIEQAYAKNVLEEIYK